jgi:hypothetical protein
VSLWLPWYTGSLCNLKFMLHWAGII